jgi:hypothetical protein
VLPAFLAEKTPLDQSPYVTIAFGQSRLQSTVHR